MRDLDAYQLVGAPVTALAALAASWPRAQQRLVVGTADVAVRGAEWRRGTWRRQARYLTETNAGCGTDRSDAQPADTHGERGHLASDADGRGSNVGRELPGVAPARRRRSARRGGETREPDASRRPSDQSLTGLTAGRGRSRSGRSRRSGRSGPLGRTGDQRDCVCDCREPRGRPSLRRRRRERRRRPAGAAPHSVMD